MPRKIWQRQSRIPGATLTLGFAVIYLLQIILLPIAALVLKASSLHYSDWVAAILAPRVLAAYRVSFLSSLVAAAISSLIGLLMAWVLVRYRFRGRGLLHAIVDLPLALPTAVAGLALTAIYSEHGDQAWLGAFFSLFGIKIAYTVWGIVVALVFVGLPLQVRSIEPVLEVFDPDLEAAASILGASAWQRFYRIILPTLKPAMLTGFALAFARGLGEYGSVIFIAGNVPMVSEIVPLIISTKLEQFDYSGATAVASVMLAASFVLLFTINRIARSTDPSLRGIKP